MIKGDSTYIYIHLDTHKHMIEKRGRKGEERNKGRERVGRGRERGQIKEL